MKQGKKSILLITELYPNNDNSFLGTFIVSQIEALKQHYRIVIIVPYASGIREWLQNKQQTPVHSKNLNIYYVKQYHRWLAWLKKLPLGIYFFINKKYIKHQVLLLAKKLHKNHQFILVHGHESYIGDEAVNIGKKLRIPSIVTIHGLYNYHKAAVGRATMINITMNLNHANRLFAVSKVAATSYQKNGVNREIDIIPNGLNDNTLKFAPPLSEKWQKIIKNKTIILTVGFFAKEKRFEQVINAAAKLKEKHGDSFVVLMIGRGGLEEYYKKLIKEKNLENHVYIVGQIPPSEMMSYYNACDFLAHPSIIESFSMACMEAASAGKPFICTSNIGLTEYITPNKEAFVIPPDNIDALTEKMDILLQNTGLRQQMGVVAKQTAETFLWKNQIHKTLAIYEQLTQV